MPYIDQARRDAIEAGSAVSTAGELNYAVTRLVTEYVSAVGIDYQAINDVVGALEGAKAEFQRRVVAPYEDAKRDTNGDVYPVLQP